MTNIYIKKYKHRVRKIREKKETAFGAEQRTEGVPSAERRFRAAHGQETRNPSDRVEVWPRTVREGAPCGWRVKASRRL